jgi:hypothetical protein
LTLEIGYSDLFLKLDNTINFACFTLLISLLIFLFRTKSFINTRSGRKEVSMIIPRNLLFHQDFTRNGFVLRQSRRMPCKLHWGSPTEASQNSTGINNKASCSPELIDKMNGWNFRVH